MPRNPLLMTNMNRSKTNVERPTPVTPEMEVVEGHNLPWRGINSDHGVKPNDDSVNPDPYSVDVSGTAKHVDMYEKPEHETNPIPVYIVNSTTAREYREFWTDRRTVTDGVSSLLGRDNNRVTARLRNTDAAKTMYVASNFADLALRGYPLAPGTELTIAGEMPVYVCTTDGTAATVGMYVETVVPES
jgi:hypothetical protein